MSEHGGRGVGREGDGYRLRVAVEVEETSVRGRREELLLHHHLETTTHGGAARSPWPLSSDHGMAGKNTFFRRRSWQDVRRKTDIATWRTGF